MAVLEFSVVPIGAGESVSQFVAKAVDVVDKSGLDYRLHSMGTVVEGEVGQLLEVMQQAIDAVMTDCDRVSVSAKLDVRKGHAAALDAKVASVEQKLGREVKH
ncbi:MAG: thiamine-binding protein [Planctomycetota bacterium]|nr:MAG: thiamine-binding protein [Planctomycetota bacterium]